MTNHSIMAHLKVVGADIPGSLSKISQRNIQLFDIVYEDDLTARLYVNRKEYRHVIRQLESYGNTVSLLNSSVQLSPLDGLLKRPALIIGLIGIVIVSMLLTGKILFVKVIGNVSVPTRKIMEEAADCGVKFYGDGAAVRSEVIKNNLLQSIPQLQWAGVNIQGCVATISVEEKTTVEETAPAQGRVSSIVASCDGIIDSITVLSGNCLCNTGQAVKEGQILISGYTDCGLQIRAEQANGEVYAKTIHNICAVFPLNYQYRSSEGEKNISYQIKIGKNLINFRKGSGISPAVCVNMYEERYLSLPGGFQLPVSVIKKTEIPYDTCDGKVPINRMHSEAFTQKYLLSNLVAGQVLQENVQWDDRVQVSVLSGQYLCREMIGRTKTELMIQGDTDRD